jgi:hypothetical protein
MKPLCNVLSSRDRVTERNYNINKINYSHKITINITS